MQELSSIMNLLASFYPTLTLPSANNMAVLFKGAILSSHNRTISSCILAAWPWVIKHWSAYENFLRRAKIPLRDLSKILFKMVLELIPKNMPVDLVVDESLVRRWGPKVVGVGMHRDAVRSSKSKVAVTPGHKWIVLSINVYLPYVNRALSLPVLCVLYMTKKHAKRNRAMRPYNQHRTIAKLTLMLVWIASKWLKSRDFRLIGDGAYCSHDLTDALNKHSNWKSLVRGVLISRFRMDGVTYDEPPKKRKKKKGRPAIKGKRLQTPGQYIKKKRARWEQVNIAWYGGAKKKLMLCSRTGIWYKCGNKAKMIRWVVVRDPDGKRRDEVFYSSDPGLSPKVIVELYVSRWSLETTFQEAREHLGLETLKNRSLQSVMKSVPMLLSIYSIIAVWFAKNKITPEDYKIESPWYKKKAVTFSDMYKAAKLDILKDPINPHSTEKTREFLFNQGLYELLIPQIIGKS